MTGSTKRREHSSECIQARTQAKPHPTNARYVSLYGTGTDRTTPEVAQPNLEQANGATPHRSMPDLIPMWLICCRSDSHLSPWRIAVRSRGITWKSQIESRVRDRRSASDVKYSPAPSKPATPCSKSSSLTAHRDDCACAAVWRCRAAALTMAWLCSGQPPERRTRFFQVTFPPIVRHGRFRGLQAARLAHARWVTTLGLKIAFDYWARRLRRRRRAWEGAMKRQEGTRRSPDKSTAQLTLPSPTRSW